jgi:hypothetical protein
MMIDEDSLKALLKVIVTKVYQSLDDTLYHKNLKAEILRAIDETNLTETGADSHDEPPEFPLEEE